MLKEHIQYVFLISRKICHISRQWSVGGLWSQVTILYSFAEHLPGAPNETIIQNHLNIALLNVFQYLNVRYRHIFIP